MKYIKEVDKKYSDRNLRSMRQFYLLFKDEIWNALRSKLSWTHYRSLLKLRNIDEISYYIKVCEEQNLSTRQLDEKIKLNEYERLPESTKNKLIEKQENSIEDFLKNPIIINNKSNYEVISEKILKQMILEDIPSFLNQLGEGFCFIKNEYPIKIGDRYNYIDLLLFNIKYNCYVVVELKITELNKNHLGQIQVYMNYIDKNLKKINQNKTIGIIVCYKNNEFIIEYSSDPRIYITEYKIREDEGIYE